MKGDFSQPLEIMKYLICKKSVKKMCTRICAQTEIVKKMCKKICARTEIVKKLRKNRVPLRGVKRRAAIDLAMIPAPSCA